MGESALKSHSLSKWYKERTFMQYRIIANTTSRPIWSKGERFQWTSFKEFFSRSTFCKISNNFSWNSLDFKFGHFKIFDELIFQFWRLSVRFSDNYIAKRFQCVGSRAGYVVQFRLAPYFHEPKFSCCQNYQTDLTLSLGESSNSSVQKVQMMSSFDFGTRRKTVLPHAI